MVLNNTYGIIVEYDTNNMVKNLVSQKTVIMNDLQNRVENAIITILIIIIQCLRIYVNNNTYSKDGQPD